ncbi:NUDIX domain-containing protein [Paenibacillus dokdonensis]|uniref:NUDIX domain-containing protein n=1 Tax=Paenibacillus dokdonensis TaxID=2567944 RepID=A0ABU6GNW0_9BACL|nr:NUDIX domain-containing protein [Paenibacillus dokdonensis]MEC0240370.1 NUDIX domain-containing protein [Paenibacillus dokdonensis]
MELLAELSDFDAGDFRVALNNKYQLRRASRAVILNDFNQIALLFVSKNNYHKLPGGGIEQGENVTEALIREVLEEVGAEISVHSEVGVIIEYRNKHEMMQLSYCFLARLEKIKEAPSYTEEEKSNGFALKWVDMEKALALLNDDRPKDYVGKLIRKRDYIFLTKAKELIMNVNGEKEWNKS